MSRLSKRRATSAALVLLAVAAGAWALAALRVSTDVTHFMPDAEDRQLGAIASLLSDSELTRTWILVIGAADAEEAAEASRRLEARLGAHPEVADVRASVTRGVEEAVRELYLPRAVYLWDDEPDRDARLRDRGLRAAARELRRELGLPTSALVRASAPEDPLLSFPRRIEDLARARGGDLTLHDGRLVTADGRRAVLFLVTRSSPFRSDAQAPLAAAIDEAFAEVNDALGGGLALEQSAVHRFALDSERSIRADLTRIGGIGGALVLLLFLVVFRSLRQVLLLLLPLSVGLAGALAASALVFGEVHGITLAFGSALIGVCVDYAIHLSTHHLLGPEPEPAKMLRSVWPSIQLGGLTTVAGLAGLAIATFPGLREIAVFATVGVLGALLATRWVLPPWLPVQPRRSPAARRIAAALGRVVDAVGRRRPLVLLGWGLLLLTAAFGLPQLTWVDSLRALNELDPALEAEDTRVRALVSRMDAGRFVVAQGHDLEEALARNDRAHHALAAARDAGELDDFRSLHDFLWSEELQRENLAALRGAGDLGGRLDRAFAAEGFVAGTFEPFLGRLASPPPPLRWQDLSTSPLGDAVRPFHVEAGGRAVILTFVRGVGDTAVLATRLEGLEGVQLLDQQELLTTAYGRYRTRTLEMVAVGLVAVLALVFLRYRRIDLAMAAFLPALLAALATLGLLGLLGMEANLMHLVALLLVLSMGVDYGVFVVEHRLSAESLEATLAGIVTACLTTVLSFGLLAMSSNPALRSLGLAVAIGVLLALCLAPASLVLLGRRGRP